MYPYPLLPKPLPITKFYILLALCRGDSSRYQLKSIIHNDSLGSINISDTQAYRAVRELSEDVLVEMLRTEPGRVAGTVTEIYGISEHGLIRLREEMARLEQAVKIARHAGVLDNTMPIELQRLRLDLLDGGK